MRRQKKRTNERVKQWTCRRSGSMCRDSEKGKKRANDIAHKKSLVPKSQRQTILWKFVPVELNSLWINVGDHRCIDCESTHDFQIDAEPAVSHSTRRRNEMSWPTKEKNWCSFFFCPLFLWLWLIATVEGFVFSVSVWFLFHFFYARLSCVFYIPIWLQ